MKLTTTSSPISPFNYSTPFSVLSPASNITSWASSAVTPAGLVLKNSAVLDSKDDSSSKIWFSDEQIELIRNTVIEALYLALKPGTLPSACVFLFDCVLTAFHFLVSSYIHFDFTTIFLGTVYFPCILQKFIYVIEIFLNDERVRQAGDTLNQIFNITIILSCLAYNIMCTFVLKYRKVIPIPVARSVFLPIFLFCSFVVIFPKFVAFGVVDRFFQFVTQLFGSLFLLLQIFINIYLHIAGKIESDKVCFKVDRSDKAMEIVENADSRLIWANVFSLILVLLTIPQIVDYQVALTVGWISYHFLIQSLAQLNSLILSFAVFLVLPTYRNAIFGCFGKYDKVKVAIAKTHHDEANKKKKAATAEPSIAEEYHTPVVPVVEMKKEPKIEPKKHGYIHHVSGAAMVHNHRGGGGGIKIFMTPVKTNHVGIAVEH